MQLVNTLQCLFSRDFSLSAIAYEAIADIQFWRQAGVFIMLGFENRCRKDTLQLTFLQELGMPNLRTCVHIITIVHNGSFLVIWSGGITELDDSKPNSKNLKTVDWFKAAVGV